VEPTTSQNITVSDRRSAGEGEGADAVISDRGWNVT
jgi:hypothetical protein